MRAKELARIFRLLSEILEDFGDMSATKALESIHDDYVSKKKVPKTGDKGIKADVVVVDDIFINHLRVMSSDEIRAFLNSQPWLKNKSTLIDIAKRIDITLSNRQNTDQMIHTIIKYFERENMDKNIRKNRSSTFDNDLDNS